MKQHTLNKEYTFIGKGLHTGGSVGMTILPAPIDHGIVFERTDMGGARVAAAISNLTTTDRSTCIRSGEADVITTEHLLSSLSGLGVDNALIRLTNREVPILDGSALAYVNAIRADGLRAQSADREYFVVEEPFEYRSGESVIRLEPCNHFEVDVEIAYPSKVLSYQSAHYDDAMDYSSEIAACRTFCFFHEIEFLLAHNLIKGGDMDNAIVIVEEEVSQETLERMKSIFNVSSLKRIPSGYLNNIKLRFDNECARHKLLDVMGDFALAGKPMKAKISAYKPGHAVNTAALKALVSQKGN